jgi:hypothetical protein
MIQDADNSNWYKLAPDSKGNYVDGTWTKLASTPSWGPLYYASQVLTDGRVIAMGGEYNFGNSVWDNQGFIYDPVANVWTPLPAPVDWDQIGDMGSVTLPNGKVLLADPFDSQCALFDPVSNMLTSPVGSGKSDRNDEEGLTLLPNGNIFTVSVTLSDTVEMFNSTTLTWSKLANTPYNVVDLPDQEIGPAVLQYNGQIIQFGGNGSNAIYDPASNTWSAAPSFPTVSAGQLDCADAPAVLLPNGNVLVETGPGYALGGCYFYIWNGSTLTAVTGPPDSASNVDFAGNFLLLPNGQVLFTDQSPNVMLYNPGGAPNSSWAPAISYVPSIIREGSSYEIQGTQFNGLSGGSAYGDDEQNETNYPIIKLTIKATGDVYYGKEFNPSTMAICTGSQTVSTHFTVPLNAELGAATVQVVTNGIASAPVSINVYPPLPASNVSVLQGTNGRGSVAAIDEPNDGLYYYATSISSSQGQIVGVEADFQVSETTLGSVTVKAQAAAKLGVTEQIYVYDYVAGAWVMLAETAFLKGQTPIAGSNSINASRFVNSQGVVRTLIRGVEPVHVSASTYTIAVDLLALAVG